MTTIKTRVLLAFVFVFVLAFTLSNAQSVLFVRGADGSGGHFEPQTDPTEQLAGIFNNQTFNGNHGWGNLAQTLRDNGFTTQQVIEGPGGSTPVNFAGMNLAQYDVIVLGSNNAPYNTTQVNAIEQWVRNGGGLLTISDTNFGSSWCDASDSDQSFLSRFGIIVNQDFGTYVLRRSNGDFIDGSHPILNGIDNFDGEGVTPLSVANNIPNGVTVNRIVRAPSNLRQNNGSGAQCQGSIRGPNNNDAVLITATAGSGRVVGTFDRNTFFNQNGAGTNISRFNNRQYAINIFQWLAQAGNNPPTTQGPFGGVARNIPGTIEAEDYDTGGQGVAYNDTDAGNNGPNVARENENVDIEARDGGLNVGWVANGEWLEYTVNATAGTYDLQARIATTTTGKSIVAKLDGVTLGTFNLPNTNGWGNFQTITIPNVTVTGGTGKILRLEFVGGGLNLNWVRFAPTGQPGGCDLPYSNTGVVTENQTTNFSTNLIDISCASSVNLSLRASGVGAMENADFLNIFYKLDGGPQVPILQNVNTYAQQTLEVNNLSGNTLEIIVNAFTSFTGEVYTVDNISISEVVSQPSTNLVENPGMETGNLSSWTAGFGTRVVDGDAASGSFAVKITGPAGHAQNITVQPNTTYTLSANIKSQTGSVFLGVKNYGGAEKANNISSASYTNSSLTFTTGASNTSAQIYLYTGTAGNMAFGDDFSVTVGSSGARKGEVFDKVASSRVYPNPITNGHFTLDLSTKDGISDVTIFDTRGRAVYETRSSARKLDLDSNILPAKGMYIFRISNNGKSEVIKLIKK